MATFSYDVALEPTYIDYTDIGSGYGILSIPVDGFFVGDVIEMLSLIVTPRTGPAITKTIDMVQRTDGYFAYTSPTSIAAHFTLLPEDLVAINAGVYTYSAGASVTRNGVTRSREIQAGNIRARPMSSTPPLIVASVVVTGGPATGIIGGTHQLTGTCYDAYGNVLPGQQITWASGDVTVAQVNVNGLVTFVAPGACLIFATSQGIQASTSATTSGFTSPVTGQIIAYNGAAWEPTGRVLVRADGSVAIAANSDVNTAGFTVQLSGAAQIGSLYLQTEDGLHFPIGILSRRFAESVTTGPAGDGALVSEGTIGFYPGFSGTPAGVFGLDRSFTLASLAGTGLRPVFADANGKLSAP